MASIQRRDLYQALDRIKKQRQWRVACDRLAQKYYPDKNLCYSEKFGRGSHAVIYDANFESTDLEHWRVATVQKHLRKDVNQHIFVNFLRHGIQEDDIWEALGML